MKLKMKFNTDYKDIIKYLSTTNLLLCRVGNLEMYDNDILVNSNSIEFFLGKDNVTDEETLKKFIIDTFKYDDLVIDFEDSNKSIFFELLPKLVELSKTDLIKVFKILEEKSRNLIYTSTRGFIRKDSNKLILYFGWEDGLEEPKIDSYSKIVLGATDLEVHKPRESKSFRLDVLRHVVSINFKKIETVLKTIDPELELEGTHPIDLNIIEANAQIMSAFNKSSYQIFKLAEPGKNSPYGEKNYLHIYGKWNGPINDFLMGHVGVGYKVVGDNTFPIYIDKLTTILDSSDNSRLNITDDKTTILERFPTLFSEEKINNIIKISNFINSSIGDLSFKENLISLRRGNELSNDSYYFEMLPENVLQIHVSRSYENDYSHEKLNYDGTLMWSFTEQGTSYRIIPGDVEPSFKYFRDKLL